MSAPHRVAPRASTHCPGFVTDLIARCGRGDETALARLFQLFYVPISAAVTQQAPGGGAEELTATVFVRLWRHAPDYRPGDQSPVDWVMEHVSAVMSGSSVGVESRSGPLAAAISPTAGALNHDTRTVPADPARHSPDPETGWPPSASTTRLSFSREQYADHGPPSGGRLGGEFAHQRSQPSRASAQRHVEGPR